MTPTVFRNKILAALSSQAIKQLRLSPLRMAVKDVLVDVGQPLSSLVFPETGMASMTASFSDGAQVEVGMFGYDSMVGAPALMGATHSLHRVYVQIAGHAYVSPLNAAMREFKTYGRFQDIVLLNAQAQLVQATQSAACNAKHGVEERLVSWLMLCRDRTQNDTFLLSHEYLAFMLGSTRATVSVMAADLKSKGLIDYSRGVMQLLDLPGLKERACECYPVVKAYLEEATTLGNGSRGDVL